MTRHEALVELLRVLRSHDYRFTAVTPATHERVLAREHAGRVELRDIFGWNRSLRTNDLDQSILGLLQHADALETADDGTLKSRVRVASLGDDLFLHSAFPTTDANSVFFGPDTYRFVSFVERQLARCGAVRRLVDMGAGSGAGGIAVARCCGDAEVTLVDVNPLALEFARINAEAARVAVALVQSDQIPPGADLVIANPPYMIDPLARSYRDGGDLLGGAVALGWVRKALSVLAPGGTMLLYTGAAYVSGRSPLIEAIERECSAAGAALQLEEIDPDVFGEALGEAAYSDVDRIAAVGLTIIAPPHPPEPPK